MPILAASVGLALHRFRTMTSAERCVFLVLPTAMALANLSVHYVGVVPRLTGDSRPTHAYFWANYGDTPMLALLGMATQPWRVFVDTMTSGFFRTVIVPHLFLPIAGWRWALGIVPVVAIYSASANEQLRGFGIYYAIVLVPFLVIAASSGALTLARRFVTNTGHARLAAAAVVLLGALFVGSGSHGYSLRPWRQEVAAVPATLAQLTNERLVLVQSGLYPHAGYDAHIHLLTPETLHDPRHLGAAVLVAPAMSSYPFGAGELASFKKLRPIRSMPSGIVVSRLLEAPAR
jgi:hypothetical protein